MEEADSEEKCRKTVHVFMPKSKSEDFEEAFKKALVKIKPFIDSLAVDYDSKLKAQLSNATDEKFDEIISQLNQEDE